MNLILYLKDHALLVVDQADSDLQNPTEVDWKDEGALDAFFKSVPQNAKLKLVFDFIDESLQYEWVPKLLPWEKPALEKRLLAKARANGGEFVHCQWLPIFQHNGSRDEQLVLIASVLKSPQLVQFLESIQTYQLSVTRLYSHAFLVAKLFFKRLAPKLKLSTKQLKMPFMLVFREGKFRFRQLFFIQGELRISRSVLLDEKESSELAIHQQLGHETEIAVKYLYNQKILSFGTPVSFVYLNHLQGNEEDMVSLYQQNVADSSWDASDWFAMEGDLTKLLNLPEMTESQAVIKALSLLIFKSNPKTFYQWEYVHRHRLLTEVSVGLQFLWFGATVAGLALLIQQGVQIYLLMEKQTLLQNQTIVFMQEKQRLQDTTQLPYDAEDVKATVEFSEAIMRSQEKGMLGLDLVTLSQVVQQHPHILIEYIDWRKANKLDRKDVSADIRGWVFPFHQTFQPSVQWVDEFKTALEKMPGVVEVKLVQEPLDRNLQKSLEVKEETVDLVKALPFSVSLQWRSPPVVSEEGS